MAHWTPDDYYAARIRAFGAWKRSQPQLVLGLEGADAGTTSLVASAPSNPQGGLAAGEETGPSGRVPGGRGEDLSPAASPPSPHADGTHSDTPPRVGEGGLELPHCGCGNKWCPDCHGRNPV